MIFAKNIFLVTLDFLGGNTCQGTTFSRAVNACKMTIPRCRRLARSEAQHIEQMSSAASCNRMACEAECAEKSTGSLKALEPSQPLARKGRPLSFFQFGNGLREEKRKLSINSRTRAHLRLRFSSNCRKAS